MRICPNIEVAYFKILKTNVLWKVYALLTRRGSLDLAKGRESGIKTQANGSCCLILHFRCKGIKAF